MINTKRVIGIYPAWEYTREIDDLNRMSENGWQLTKGGLFSNHFKKNDDIRYKYQLDYNTHIEDMGRYIETFREQGWEYVCSLWNGWHYFRKLYDPSLPASEYEIYNDNQSLTEMQGKWKKLATGATVVLVLFFILELIFDIRAFRIPTTILCTVMLIEAILIGRGAFEMRNAKRAGNAQKKGTNFKALMCILLAGFILTFLSVCFRTEGIKSRAESYAAVPSGEVVSLYEMKINYPDFYHFELKGNLGSPATFILKNNKTGEEVFTMNVTPDADGKFSIKRGNNFLKRGSYDWRLTDFAGGRLDVDIYVE